jgi:phosphoribosylanthranilate isomerase
MWIKICGNTTLEDAQLAAENGANAVGFVFASSPRRVGVAQVREITPLLPAGLEKIGVFVDASCNEIAATVLECGLTGVQLHASFDSGLTLRLRDRFAALPAGRAVKILQVLHFGADFEEQLSLLRSSATADAVLVDSRTAKAVGGTGISFDWSEARRGFAGFSLPMIAAGGLRPENVAEAIQTLHPWGVDVSSGVEASPGKKDPERVRGFVDAARSAVPMKAIGSAR